MDNAYGSHILKYRIAVRARVVLNLVYITAVIHTVIRDRSVRGPRCVRAWRACVRVHAAVRARVRARGVRTRL
jgi:hypothetical protein